MSPTASQTVKLLPLSPDTLPGLRSYSTQTTFWVDGMEGVNDAAILVPVGFDVQSEGVIHYDRREGMIQRSDTGHRTLAGNPGYTMVLVLGQTADRTYRVWVDEPDYCEEVEWVFKPSRFEEAYGSFDILNDYRNLHFVNAENELPVLFIDEVEVNGVATNHYRVDPARATDLLEAQYEDFEGELTGEVYIAQEGGFLMKAHFELRGPNLPTFNLPFTTGPMRGVLRDTYEADNLNSAPPVTIPPTCQEKVATAEAARSTPTRGGTGGVGAVPC